MTIQIVGFSDSYKVPIFAAETVYGAGLLALGSIPQTLLLVGLKSNDGVITEDASPVDCFDQDEADYQGGPGSELALMFAAAVAQDPSLRIKIAAPARAGGAVAASATITITGPATSSGDYRYRIDGVVVSDAIANGTSANSIAAAIAAKFNANDQLPVTAEAVGAVVTLTVKSEGIRGNQYILHQIDDDLPSGVTSTLGGGGASVTGGGVKFASGAGTESVTTLLTALFPGRYHRIAIAQNDTTNLPLWKTQLNSKAGPLENRTEHAVYASNGTQSAATSLSSSTVNDPRFQGVWMLNSESHPSELAAAMAARRASKAPSQPNVGFDGDVLVGIAPQAFVADWAQQSVQQSCLDNGTTPLATQPDGTITVVRAITTKCLDGANFNYETLDVGTAETPDYVRDNLSLIWHQEFKVANPYVADDPPAGAKPRPAGIATPTLWKNRVRTYLKTLEERENPILVDVDANQPRAEWNAAAKRIMSAVPVNDAPVQHQIGVSVRQIS